MEECKFQGKVKAMCWIGLLDGDIMGPFWFFDESGAPANVNQHRYLEMLNTQVWPCLQNRRNLRHVWFQQDGATCHTTDRVLSWLNTKFSGRVISRRNSLHWPAQSPDLNPVDYYFWGTR